MVFIERAFDGIVWQTILSLVKAGSLERCVTLLQNPEFYKVSTPKIIAKIGADLGLDVGLVVAWKKLTDS